MMGTLSIKRTRAYQDIATAAYRKNAKEMAAWCEHDWYGFN